jgi:hypothetical protein
VSEFAFRSYQLKAAKPSKREKTPSKMTRPNQKASERQTLDRVLNALGLRPDAEPVEGETPDFMVTLSGRRVGVEVTMYRSADVVEGGVERRQAEAEWAKLLSASHAFRGARPELRGVNVGLMFKGPVPPQRRHAEFMKEVAAFICLHYDDLKSSDTDYWPWNFSTPLMCEYLQTLYLRICPHAVWHANFAAGFVALPETSTIAEIVAEKSRKQFRPADELWLVIQSGTLISEMLLDIQGVEDYSAVKGLEDFQFSRVFVLAFNGAYQWKRGDGWCKLTGPGDAARA